MTVGDRLVVVIPDASDMNAIGQIKLLTATALTQAALKNGLDYHQLLEQYIISLRYVEAMPIYKMITRKIKEKLSKESRE